MTSTFDLFACLAPENWQNDRATAENPASRPLTLAELVSHEAGPVRVALARNLGTPSATLKLLGDDPEASVRDAVAARPDIERHLVNWAEQDGYTDELPVSFLRAIYFNFYFAVDK